MAELVFYSNPQSRGQIAHWMLEEVGEAYETHWLVYGGAMKRPDYLAVNPMGKVPALRHLRGGKEAVVTEAAAICAYLAAAFPHKGLMPEGGSPALADYYRWLFFAAGPLEMAVTARTLNWPVSAEQSSMVGFGSYQNVLDTLEGLLAARRFACGDSFTAADVYLGAQVIWGLRFNSIEPRAAFKAYAERLTQRPAYQRAEMLINAQLATQPK